jgi:hypothetical protein
MRPPHPHLLPSGEKGNLLRQRLRVLSDLLVSQPDFRHGKLYRAIELSQILFLCQQSLQFFSPSAGFKVPLPAHCFR